VASVAKPLPGKFSPPKEKERKIMTCDVAGTDYHEEYSLFYKLYYFPLLLPPRLPGDMSQATDPHVFPVLLGEKWQCPLCPP
jgi:hypothetical protein